MPHARAFAVFFAAWHHDENKQARLSIQPPRSAPMARPGRGRALCIVTGVLGAGALVLRGVWSTAGAVGICRGGRCGFAARRQTWTACGRIAAAWANRRSAHTPWWPHGVGLWDRRLCSRCHGRSTDVLYRSTGGHRVGVGPPSSPLSCTTPTSWLVMDLFDRSSFSPHAWSESKLWREWKRRPLIYQMCVPSIVGAYLPTKRQ